MHDEIEIENRVFAFAGVLLGVFLALLFLKLTGTSMSWWLVVLPIVAQVGVVVVALLVVIGVRVARDLAAWANKRERK